MMRREDIPKRTRKAVKARIKATIEKYGYDETRAIVNAYFINICQRRKLQRQIVDSEKGLVELKKQLRR